MKKFLIAALCCLAASTAGAEGPVSKIPDLIENRTYGFRVSNPDRWQALRNKTDNLVLLGYPTKPKLNFVTVTVEDLSKTPGVTLDAYRRQLAENLKKSVIGFEIRSEEPSTVDGEEAREIIYAGRLAEAPMRWKTVFALKKNRAYVITYAAEENEYFRHLESADKILFSFRFI